MGINNWLRTIRIKILHWEYWPTWLIYLPASFYYFYLCLKARNFHFYSAANPSIETGGMFFESKWDIYSQIPTALIPATILVKANTEIEMVLETMKRERINFPCIVKPDRGEKGWLVTIVKDQQALTKFLLQHRVDMLVQQKIDYPLEFGVFYCKLPGQESGFVSSIVEKQPLSVTGDGLHTISELIDQDDRSFLVKDTLMKANLFNPDAIPAAQEKLILMPFGNHIRGAKFINRQDLITERVAAFFETVCAAIPDFYFGRMDVKCLRQDSLHTGEGLIIIELNGSGAMPGHILDPGFSYLKAQAVICNHMKWMYQIAVDNHQKGVRYMNWKEYRQTKLAERKYKQKAG
jgi:hypothetical protein